MATIRTERHKARQWRVESALSGVPGHHVVSGDCSSPIELPAFGYPDKVAVGLGIETDWPVHTTIYVRCRKCEMCLNHRSNLWAARACTEVTLAQRTWFGTLTLAPVDATRIRALARRRWSAQRGEDLDAASQPEQTQEFARQAAPLVTKFLKRVRAQCDGPLRYLLVVEAHKSGLPHWHLLVHEQSEPVTKRTLEAQWRSGFSHWRLVNAADPSAAFYVCKYLAKSLEARVRSSSRYGTGGLNPPKLAGLTKPDTATTTDVRPQPVKEGGSKNDDPVSVTLTSASERKD